MPPAEGEGGALAAPTPAPPRMKLFVSYSWRNLGWRQSLVAALIDQKFEPSYDAGFLNIGDELSKNIAARISECDGLVALLTRSALKSSAVHEELVRAHSQHLKIYALVDSDVLTKLPWFVIATLVKPFRRPDITAAIVELAENIARDRDHLREHAVASAVRKQFYSLRQLRKKAEPGSDVRRMKFELARSITENAVYELDSLHDHVFTSIVGGGSNFLMRARPVFENAEYVFAVSLDGVSTFWVSPEPLDQEQARQYLRSQPRKTHRLFVFSKPENAHNYATILNSHARRYGTEGRVFLCSTQVYTSLLARLGLSVSGINPTTSDFALLEYSTPGGLAMFRATLDGDRFSVAQERGNSVVRRMEEFKSFLNGLRSLDEGAIDAETRIMRWKVDFQAEPKNWAAALRTLFESRPPDFFHAVFFARGPLEQQEIRARLDEAMREVRALLADLSDSRNATGIRLRDYWVGEYHGVLTQDGATTGTISNEEASHYPLILLLRFEDEESLDLWYRDATHAKLRRLIYQILDARLPVLFDRIDVAGEDKQAAADIYAEVEEIARTHVSRRDYRELETMDDIVRRTPFRPRRRMDG